MTLERFARARKERINEKDEKYLSEDPVRASEAVWSPQENRVVQGEVDATFNFPEQLGAVRERLRRRTSELSSDTGGKDETLSISPERTSQKEAVEKFIEELNFRRNRHTTSRRISRSQSMPPDKALSAAIEQVHKSDALYRRKIFVGTGAIAGLAGMAGLAISLFDSATGASLLGQQGELLASNVGIGTMAAAIPAALIARGGLKLFHSLRERRQWETARKLLRR